MLTTTEKSELIRLIEANKPIPDKYRFLLFNDKREVELVWNGKTSEVCNIALPFQTIEQIDEPRAEKDTKSQHTFFDLDARGRQLKGWTNKLIWGDNKLILSSLKNGPLRQEIKKAGGIKLIYIDPPFDVGADFSMDIAVGDETFHKEASILEEIAYRDTWGKGADSFIAMIYERLVLMRDLLAEYGSIYVHCDWRVNSYIRMAMDEVFGKGNFRNEIIWKRRMSKTSPDANRMENIVDYIFLYTKGNEIFNLQYTQYGAEKYIQKSFNKIDKDGRKYQSTALNAPKPRPTLIYTFMGYPPPKNGWSVTEGVMQKYYNEGKLILPKNKEGRIRRKQYLDEWNGYEVNTLWTDIQVIASQSNERLDYPTQKPEALLERIIKASSNEGDIVADFFAGSGTTAAVAEKLGRKWIASDLGKFAIHTTRKRMIQVQRQMKTEGKNYRAFKILNLGKYERQHYIGVNPNLREKEKEKQILEREKHFTDLILHAYKAQPVEGFPMFQGKKAGRLLAVGPINLSVTRLFVEKIIFECRKNQITQVDILAFEFEMGLFPNILEEAKAKGIHIAPKYIPRDVFDKRAVEKNQVIFHDVSYIEIKPLMKGKSVAVELTDYSVYYTQDTIDHVAESLKNGKNKITVDNGEIVKVIKDDKGIVKREVITKHWTDWIDYWSVDFDFEKKREIVRVPKEIGGDEQSQLEGFQNEQQNFINYEEKWTGDYIFENEWQSFRTKKDRSIELKSGFHEYESGRYKIAVKVVDIFGNDTMKVIEVGV